MTLLRAMLEAHDDLHIPPETFVLGTVVRDFRRYSRLPWSVLLGMILAQFEFHPHWHTWEITLGALFRELERQPPDERNLAAVLDGVYRAHLTRYKPSAIRWGDKTPRNTFVLRELRAVFPDLQVVHMIRDGRDVVESLGRLADRDLSCLARHWLDSVRVAQTFGAHYGSQYLEVRYEDLVRQPEKTLRAIVAFLEHRFEERMLRHHELGLALGDVERRPHLQGVRAAVHQNSIGRWRTTFNSSQVDTLERLLSPMLVALGYADGGGR